MPLCRTSHFSFRLHHTQQVGSVNIDDVLNLGRHAKHVNRRVLDVLRMHLPRVEQEAANNMPRLYPPPAPGEGGFGEVKILNSAAGGQQEQEDLESMV